MTTSENSAETTGNATPAHENAVQAGNYARQLEENAVASQVDVNESKNVEEEIAELLEAQQNRLGDVYC